MESCEPLLILKIGVPGSESSSVAWPFSLSSKRAFNCSIVKEVIYKLLCRIKWTRKLRS